MISQKIMGYCTAKAWWQNEPVEMYESALAAIGLERATDIAYFYTHADNGPTFFNGRYELFHLGWFIINTRYDLDLHRTRSALKLPDEFYPLSSFEGGWGIYYDRRSKGVYEIELGPKIQAVLEGNVFPDYPDFNAFLESYFDLP